MVPGEVLQRDFNDFRVVENIQMTGRSIKMAKKLLYCLNNLETSEHFYDAVKELCFFLQHNKNDLGLFLGKKGQFK